MILVIRLINVSLVELHNYARYIYFSVCLFLFFDRRCTTKYLGRSEEKQGRNSVIIIIMYTNSQVKNIIVGYLFFYLLLMIMFSVLNNCHSCKN